MNEENKKLTIIIPNSVFEHLENIKEACKLKTLSGTTSLCIEIFDWILKVQNEGFEVKAEKREGSSLIIQKLPLIKREENSNGKL